MPFHNLVENDFFTFAIGLLGSILGIAQVTYVAIRQPELSYTIAATAHQSSLTALTHFFTPPFLSGLFTETIAPNDTSTRAQYEENYVTIHLNGATATLPTNDTHIFIEHPVNETLLAAQEAHDAFIQDLKEKAHHAFLKQREKDASSGLVLTANKLEDTRSVTSVLVDELWRHWQNYNIKLFQSGAFRFIMVFVLVCWTIVEFLYHILQRLHRLFSCHTHKEVKSVNATQSGRETKSSKRELTGLSHVSKLLFIHLIRLKSCQKKMSNLLAQKAAFRLTIRWLKSKVAELSADITSKAENIASLTSDCEQLRATLANKMEQMSKLTIETQKRYTSRVVAETERVALIQSLETTIARLEKEVKDKTTTISENESVIQSRDRAIADRERTAKNRTQEVKVARKEKEDAVQREQFLRTKLELDQHERLDKLSTLSSEKTSLSQQKKELEQRLAQTELSLEASREEIAKRERRVGDLERRFSEQSNSISARELVVDKITRERDDALKTGRDLKASNTLLLKNMKADEAQKIVEIEGKYHKALNDLTAVRKENTSLAATVGARTATISMLESDMQEAREKNTALNEAVKKLETGAEVKVVSSQSAPEVSENSAQQVGPASTPSESDVCGRSAMVALEGGQSKTGRKAQPRPAKGPLTEEDMIKAASRTPSKLAIMLKETCGLDTSLGEIQIRLDKKLCAICAEPGHTAQECAKNSTIRKVKESHNETAGQVELPKTTSQNTGSAAEGTKPPTFVDMSQSKWADSSFKPTPKSDIDDFYKKRAFQTTFGTLPSTTNDEQNIDKLVEDLGDSGARQQPTESSRASPPPSAAVTPSEHHPSPFEVEYTPTQPLMLGRYAVTLADPPSEAPRAPRSMAETPMQASQTLTPSIAPAQPSGMAASRFATADAVPQRPLTSSEASRGIGRGQGRGRGGNTRGARPQVPSWLQEMHKGK